MPSKDTNTETLKREKLWLIDEKKGEVYYDVTDDVNHGWWHKIPHGVDQLPIDEVKTENN